MPTSTSVHGESYLSPCLSSPHLEASQFSSSPYVLQAAAPALKPRASESVHGPLRGMPGIPATLCLTQMQFSLISTVKYYGDSSFWHWCSKLGSSLWGWDLSLLRGHLQLISTATCGCGASLFCVSVLPTSVIVALF